MTIYRNRSLFILSTLAISLAVTSCGEQTSGLTLVAGQERAHVDGPRSTAKFARPVGIASNNNDVMFVVDIASHTVRRVNPNGTVSTLAGSPHQAGALDGVGSAATFDRPAAIAIDKVRNRLYIADIGSNTIRMVHMNGTVTTFAGQAGQAGHVDGQGGDARFMFSSIYNTHQIPSMAVDHAGNLYVTDALGLRKITPQGNVSTHFADMTALAQMNGTFTDSNGTSFPIQASIAHDLDFKNYYVNSPNSGYSGLLIDSNDNFVTLQGNILLQISSSGGVMSSVNIPVGANVAGIQGIDSENNVLIISTYSPNLIKVNLDQQTLQQIQVLPPSFSEEYINNGLALEFKIRETSLGVVADSNGNLLSVDTTGAVIRKYNPSTISEYMTANGIPLDPEADPEEMNAPVLVQTILTGEKPVYGTDNASAFKASFMGTVGITSDNEGNLYISDTHHAIRRMNQSNNLVVTRSGKTFLSGTTDGLRDQTLFNSPSDMVFNTQNSRLYILDNNGKSIRRMTVAGATTTLDLSQPISAQHLVKSPNNTNMFVKSGKLIQRVLPNGTVSTVTDLSNYAGYVAYSGQGLAIDPQQNLYTMSSGRVLKITTQGVVDTFAGNLNNYASTNGQRLDARFLSRARVVGAHPFTGDVYVNECVELPFVSCTLRKIEQSSGLVSDTTVKTSFEIGAIHFSTNGIAYTTYEHGVYQINLN